MLAKRIIPCLDVNAGRVVKGVNFVELRMPATRSRSPAATTSRAPTRSPSSTSPPARRARHHPACGRAGGRAGLHPAHRRWRRAHVDDVRRLLNAGADKVSMNTAAVQTRSWWPTPPARSAASASSSPSTPSRSRRGQVGGLHPRRAQRTGLDAIEWARRCSPRRRRDPAHQHGPRRHQERLRSGLTRAVSDAVDIPGDRQRRCRQPGASGRRRHPEGRADAVLAASIFHFGEHTVREAKELMRARGIEVRL
jgi:cyclase